MDSQQKKKGVQPTRGSLTTKVIVEAAKDVAKAAAYACQGNSK
jgi:hypothetical protein